MEKKLKIAQIGMKRIPSREGGIEIVVEELSTRMVARGHQVVCYNRKGHHVSGKEFTTTKMKEYKGIRLKYVPTINRRGLAAMSSSFFGSLFSTITNYDVVHFHAEGPAFMCWLPKLLGKRVIVTVHGLDHQRSKWGKLASGYIMLGEKNAVRYADEVIVLSEGVQQYFKDVYGRETKFIPNGITRPKAYQSNIIKEQFGLKKDEYILFLGRIVPEKGIFYLIEAFKNVETNKKLVIAGGASDTTNFFNDLKKKADGDERIIFTGFVQGQVLGELYSNAYVYTLPSDLEGMPLSLLEAMSYGNCCLVSDIAECIEVVENKAIVFKKGNVEDLQMKLQMLCDNEEIVNKIKNQTSEFICSKYNWEDIVDQTLELYKV